MGRETGAVRWSLAGVALVAMLGGVAVADEARISGGPVLEPDDLKLAERLPAEAIDEGVVEDWDTVLERYRRNPNPPNFRNDETAPFNRRGLWEVPSRGGTLAAHSGEHYIYNKYGDLEMGIGFGAPVDVERVWVLPQGGEGAWADAIRVIGYRDGGFVAATDWFDGIDADGGLFEINLRGVDRIVFEASSDNVHGGWYGLDDLSYTEASGRSVTLTFDDLFFRSRLTASGYAGLDWEQGAGFTGAGGGGAIPAPQSPVGPEEAGDDGGRAGGDDAARGGAATPPVIVNSYETAVRGDSGQFSFPADTCGAVGPDHFVCVVNTIFQVYDKDTGALLQSLPLGTFQPGTGGDPRVLYDQFEDRWIVISTNFNNRIYFAYSNSSNPLGSWYKSSFVVSTGSDSGRWPDYPTLGYDENGIYSAAFMVGGPGHSIFAIDKSELLDGSPSLVVDAYRNLPFEGAIQPCESFGGANGALFVSRRSSTLLRVYRILGGALATIGNVSIPSHSNSPPDAPALGSGTNLDTIDARLMNAVYRDGRIYTAHTTNISGRAGIRWYDINAQTFVDVVGTINDSSLYYFFPGISANAAGDVLIGFSGSNSSQYAGCYLVGRKSDDPAGQTSAPVQYKAGTGPQNNIDGAGRNRWGDYSLTTIDPDNDQSFYTIQKFGRSTNIWGTFVAVGEYDVVPPPENDDCGSQTPDIDFDTAVPFTTLGATTDGGSESCFGGAGEINGDVWYKFIADCDGEVTVVATGDFDARLAAYLISCPSGDNEAVACGTGSMTFTPNPGFQYRLRIGGAGDDAGTGVVVVTCLEEDPCVGDIDGSGAVDTVDLLALLAAWGPCGGCDEDIDGSGSVDTVDLLALLAAWGPCP